MAGPIFGACAVLMTLSTAISLRFAIKHRHKVQYRIARRARVAAFVACALASFLAIPTIADAFDHLARHDEVSQLLSDAATLVFFASLQVMITDWWDTRAGPVWLRVAAVTIAIAALVWEYHCTDTSNLDLAAASADRPEVKAYLLTFLAFAALASLEVSTMSTRIALTLRFRGRTAATGLSVAAVGGIFVVAYAIDRGSYIIAADHTNEWLLSVQMTVSPVLAGLAMGCIAIGLTMATWSFDATPQRGQQAMNRPDSRP